MHTKAPFTLPTFSICRGSGVGEASQPPDARSAVQHQHQRWQLAAGCPGCRLLLQQRIQRRLPFPAEQGAGCSAAGGRSRKWMISHATADHKKFLNFLLVLSGGQGPEILGGPGDLQNRLSKTSRRQPHQLRLPACRAAPPGKCQQRAPPP